MIFPDINSANIAYKLLSKIGGTEMLGPILIGMSKAVHLLARGADVEEIVHITAIAVVDAQETGTSVAAFASAEPDSGGLKISPQDLVEEPSRIAEPQHAKV